MKADSSGELTALLKSYLEAGRFGRGSASSIAAESGIVLLANIDLDTKQRPINELSGLFRAFPNFLKETAFIDRISGLLPGWELPKIRKDTPSKSLGLKGDIFGEILHMLRGDISYRDYVKLNMSIDNVSEMRDAKAIEAGAAGLLKILFPNKKPREEEFYRFCVNPALELRQRVRDELCKLDREYTPLTMKSKIPDRFQSTHKLPRYVDESHVGMESSMLFSDEDEALTEKSGITGKDKRVKNSPELSGLTDDEVLIANGENSRIEFKSTLTWNLHSMRKDKKVEHAVLKTIVAFLNTEGGTLFVGIRDDGVVMGLEIEKFANDDKLLLHLMGMINNHIGKHYGDFIKYGLVSISEKKILKIVCKPSPSAVFLKWNKGEEFYTRSGPASVKLGGSEILDYSKEHFN